MDESDIKAEIAVIKKSLFGNGVKGVVSKVDDLYDKINELEILMNEKFNDTLSEFRKELENKILNSKQFKQQLVGNKLILLSIIASSIIGILF